MWQKAQAGAEIARKSYERVKRLHDQGVMTAQKLDEATANLNASVATEKAAKAQRLDVVPAAVGVQAVRIAIAD